MKGVRAANCLTSKDFLGENQEIRKRARPTDLSAYDADAGYRPISLLTEFGMRR